MPLLRRELQHALRLSRMRRRAPLSYTGTGTQKIVGELKKLYPSARILRMDVRHDERQGGALIKF